jgi:hypothetical protein
MLAVQGLLLHLPSSSGISFPSGLSAAGLARGNLSAPAAVKTACRLTEWPAWQAPVPRHALTRLSRGQPVNPGSPTGSAEAPPALATRLGRRCEVTRAKLT